MIFDLNLVLFMFKVLIFRGVNYLRFVHFNLIFSHLDSANDPVDP